MIRTIFVFFCLLLAVFLPAGSMAQQPKALPRVGYVSVSGRTQNPGVYVEAFRKGLRDLGYVEGKNIVLELRYAAEEPGRDFMAELVKANVDVLVSSTTQSIRAAKQATKTIPVVMIASFDPVETGLVDSFAHPGGNISGITRLSRELSGKRLELIKDLLPTISRVGILRNSDAQNAGLSLKDYETAAPALKLQLQILGVSGPSPDFPAAFAAAADGRVSAIVVVTTALMGRYAKRIADLAITNRLPSMFERTDYLEAGGLASYAASEVESYRRAAALVDKIL